MDKEMPWLVCDDFNEIMYAHEKEEGMPRDERPIEVFREVLEVCGLFDCRFSIYWYT